MPIAPTEMSVKNPGDDEKVLEVNHRAARTLRGGDWDGFAPKNYYDIMNLRFQWEKVRLLMLQFCKGET